MPSGLDKLEHIVVLMMENRSFDHMLGSLKAVDARIDGITNQLGNPDTNGAVIKPQPLADFQGQLDPDPDHHFPAVDLQIFGGDQSAARVANMQGFVRSYFNQHGDLPADFWAFPVRTVHFMISRALMALIALHVAAALYHTLIRRDGLLGRMLFGRRVMAAAGPAPISQRAISRMQP